MRCAASDTWKRVPTHDGAVAIVGRKNDTIVLVSGKNIEPVPIEKHLAYSPLIDAAVVVGQDQRYIGALIVPNVPLLSQFAADNGLKSAGVNELVKNPEVLNLYRRTIGEQINARAGFKAYERIHSFTLQTRPFEVPRELSAKMELKRTEINKLYARQISGLFK